MWGKLGIVFVVPLLKLKDNYVTELWIYIYVGLCSGSCAHTCTSDGRKIDSLAGLSNSRSVVLDDNVLCNSRDPYRQQENVLVHEFAHQVHRYMPTAYKNWVWF